MIMMIMMMMMMIMIRPLVPGTAQPSLYATVTFEGPPRMDQVLWPRHCVQESWGAELHKGKKIFNTNISLTFV